MLYQRKRSREAILSQLRQQQATNRARKVDEHDAIYNYVSASYSLNRALRSGTELSERHATIRDGLDSWLSDAPRDRGIFFRGVAIRAGSEWNTAQVGQVIKDPAYTSFSSSRKEAQGFGDEGGGSDGVLIVARGSLSKLPTHIQNRYGRDLKRFAGEREFLTPRNTQYRVTRTNTRKVRYSESPTTGETIRSASGNLIRTVRVVYVDLVE